MTNEREPLWSDEHIRDRYHALVPSEADMGEMEYWNVLRDVGERVSYELRDDYEAALSNQYQRIERFVELVDQLERKLQEATEANTSCTIYIASQMERIGDLEAQLAQTWQPLPDGEYGDVMVARNGEVLSVLEHDNLLGGSFWSGRFIAASIRLCRLVERAEVQPYSHRNGETEPPTVEGRYWFDGFRAKYNGNRAHVMDMVEVNERGGVYNDINGLTDEPHAYDGRWYGPIVPPWEANNE